MTATATETLTVTINGRAFTRTTKHAYTHCVAITHRTTGVWVLLSWHKSAALAQSAMQTFINRSANCRREDPVFWAKDNPLGTPSLSIVAVGDSVTL